MDTGNRAPGSQARSNGGQKKIFGNNSDTKDQYVTASRSEKSHNDQGCLVEWWWVKGEVSAGGAGEYIQLSTRRGARTTTRACHLSPSHNRNEHHNNSIGLAVRSVLSYGTAQLTQNSLLRTVIYKVTICLNYPPPRAPKQLLISI